MPGGGLPAGRLSIDVIAEVARLQADMDKIRKAVRDASGDIATSTRAANDNLSRIGVGASKNVVEFSREVARLKGQLDPTWAATERYRNEVRLLQQALAEGAISHKVYVDQLRGSVSALQAARAGQNAVTASAGQQRAGMQQLGMQVGDLSMQLGMAAQSSDPLRMAFMALGQQGGQMAQAFALMRGGAGGLANFMAGPWGAAIFAGTMVLGPLIGKLFETSDAAEKVSLSSRAMGDAQSALGGIFDMTTGKMRDQTGAAISLAKAQIILAQATAQKNLAAARGALSDATAEQYLVVKSKTWGPALTYGKPISSTVISDLLDGKMAPDKAIEGLRNLQQQGKITESRLIELTTAIANNAVETRNLKDLGDAYSSILNGKVAPGLLKTATAHRTSKAAMSEAEKYAKRLAEAEAALAVAAMQTAYAFDQRMRALDRNKSLADDMLGMQPAKAQTAAEAMSEEFAHQQDKLEELFGGWQSWNAELDGSIDRLERIGGLGGEIAGWARALRGDFSGLSGATGEALRTVLGVSAGTMTDDNGNKVAVTLGNRMEKIFEENGPFGKTMKGLLEGAGTGLAIGTSIFGTNNAGAQFGSMAGGALGQAFAEGSKTLPKPLGSFAGPLGSIVGGVLGGVLGSAFTKKPRGSGTVSNTGMATSANDAGIAGSLDSFGLGLQQSIGSIADQLGGTVGAYNVGIGRYKEYFQVASTGSDSLLGTNKWGRSANKAYDGTDAEAALRAAISVAIEQGAIQGVRAGVNTLLKSGADIEAQLAKALKFQGVFDDLKQATDPMGFALDQLTRKFDDLRAIFDEAGASAQDFADLESLLAIQRADAMEQARQDVVSQLSDPLTMQIRLMELMGESEAALASTRLLEVAGLKESLQPLQAMIYTLEDARAVIEQFAPLRDDLIKFRGELLGGSASTGFGWLTGQFRATAASAGMGDAAALAALRGVTSDWLAAAKDNAGSSLDYQRMVSEALAAVDRGVFAADAQADHAQAQIDAVKANGEVFQAMADNLGKISQQVLRENIDIRKLIDQLIRDGFSVPIEVETV